MCWCWVRTIGSTPASGSPTHFLRSYRVVPAELSYRRKSQPCCRGVNSRIVRGRNTAVKQSRSGAASRPGAVNRFRAGKAFHAQQGQRELYCLAVDSTSHPAVLQGHPKSYVTHPPRYVGEWSTPQETPRTWKTLAVSYFTRQNTYSHSRLT